MVSGECAVFVQADPTGDEGLEVHPPGWTLRPFLDQLEDRSDAILGVLEGRERGVESGVEAGDDRVHRRGDIVEGRYHDMVADEREPTVEVDVAAQVLAW